MAVTRDLARMLDAYTRWADAAVLDVLSDELWLRDVGGSFGSFRNTAVHLVSAQWVWLQRWLRRPPAGMWTPEEYGTVDALRARWRDVAAERAAFLDAQSDATLAQELPWTTLSGKSFANPLGELFLHAVNHSTYHRGQLAAFLRSAGVKPPSTDLVAWMMKGKP